MGHPARVVTAEELFQYPDARRYELVRGVPRVSEPPGGVHGRIAAKLAAHLAGHVEGLGLGTVLAETGYLVQRVPDTVRGPDVSFVSRTRLPPDQIPEQFIPGAPDLAVEILSTEQQVVRRRRNARGLLRRRRAPGLGGGRAGTAGDRALPRSSAAGRRCRGEPRRGRRRARIRLGAGGAVRDGLIAEGTAAGRLSCPRAAALETTPERDKGRTADFR